MPGPPVYPDLAANDRKALTYTTGPLARAIEVVGHPVVHLWLERSAADVDIFVYLEGVDPAGRSTYITEGRLRALHRSLSQVPYDRLSLPCTRSFRKDVTPLPDEPVFDLLPTAQSFQAGHRIRLAITGADRDSYQTPRRRPAPAIRLLRDAQHSSHVILPVME
jgi:putative CocE/NonD family hydrolase